LLADLSLDQIDFEALLRGYSVARHLARVGF